MPSRGYTCWRCSLLGRRVALTLSGYRSAPRRVRMGSSRPYKVQTREVVGKTVVAEDHVTVQLDIPPILPPDQTGRILAAELQERKFTDDGGGRLVRERGGVTVSVDPDGGSVTVSAQAETHLPPGDPSPCTCRALASLRN